MTQQSAMPHLSLITPVHNGAGFIEANVREIVSTLDETGESFEILVVCDGCTDDTEALVGSIKDVRVNVLSYADNRGKGYALCYGIHHARGRLIGWLDSDLDIHPRVIADAVREHEREPVDVVIGSKRHRDSNVDYPWQRRFFSWGFQRLVRLLLQINVRDTQVGAKVFRREMLDTVTPLLLIKTYAFDLEVLVVGAEFGFDRVAEIPIQLDYRFSGTGINRHAVRLMFQDTLAIAYRVHFLHWYVRQYARLQRERMDLLSRAGPELSHEIELPTAPNGTLRQIRGQTTANTVPE